MKTNFKLMLASLVLISAFGVSSGTALAAHEGTDMTQEQQMNSFLVNLTAFLQNVQTYIENSEEGMTMDAEPSTDTPAADLRVAMNNLFTEHVTVSANVMRNIIDDSSDLEGSKEAQLANAVEIAEAFGSLYGDDAQDAVAEAFLEHIDFSNEYAMAVDEMDEDAKDEANEELDEYLNDIAEILASVIDGLDEDTAYSVLREHEDLLNEAAEQYQEGDFEEAYETEREAIKQIQGVTDVLSAGIVDTMPSDF